MGTLCDDACFENVHTASYTRYNALPMHVLGVNYNQGDVRDAFGIAGYKKYPVRTNSKIVQVLTGIGQTSGTFCDNFITSNLLLLQQGVCHSRRA